MAQRVQVVLVCDLHDGEMPGSETVSFAMDGTSYEIDLCADHAAELRDAFAVYTGHARRARAGSAGRRSSGRRNGRADSSAIRAWARDRGLQVNDRGRIPASIVEQFRAATG